MKTMLTIFSFIMLAGCSSMGTQSMGMSGSSGGGSSSQCPSGWGVNPCTNQHNDPNDIYFGG